MIKLEERFDNYYKKLEKQSLNEDFDDSKLFKYDSGGNRVISGQTPWHGGKMFINYDSYSDIPPEESKALRRRNAAIIKANNDIVVDKVTKETETNYHKLCIQRLEKLNSELQHYKSLYEEEPKKELKFKMREILNRIDDYNNELERLNNSSNL